MFTAKSWKILRTLSMIAIIAFMLLNVAFFCIPQDNLYSVIIQELLHLCIPLVIVQILIFAAFNIGYGIEKLCSLLDFRPRKVALSVFELLLFGGSAGIFFTTDALFTDLNVATLQSLIEKLPYFSCFSDIETLHLFSYYWVLTLYIAALAISLSMLIMGIVLSTIIGNVKSAHAIVLQEQILEQQRIAKAEQAKLQQEQMIIDHLGIDSAAYEETEYYKQTGVLASVLANEKNRYHGKNSGKFGEYWAYHQLAEKGVKDECFIFNRRFEIKSEDLFREIDIIVLHPNGILVIENKDYTTKVIGRAGDLTWRFIDYYGKEQVMQSPVYQNEGHVRVFKDFLISNGLYTNDVKMPIHSIVVFTDTESDKSDEKIAGIDKTGTEAIICTSQNLCYRVEQLLDNPEASVPVEDIRKVLLTLPLFDRNDLKKYRYHN